MDLERKVGERVGTMEPRCPGMNALLLGGRDLCWSLNCFLLDICHLLLVWLAWPTEQPKKMRSLKAIHRCVCWGGALNSVYNVTVTCNNVDQIFCLGVSTVLFCPVAHDAQRAPFSCIFCRPQVVIALK